MASSSDWAGESAGLGQTSKSAGIAGRGRRRRRPFRRRLLALVSATGLATSVLALAWAGPAAAPVRAATTMPCEGCVMLWGNNAKHQLNMPTTIYNSGFVAISAYNELAMALTWDGRVFAWGDNKYGQANVPASLTHVAAISAGGTFAVALTSNGSVVAWGDNSWHQTEVPAAAKSGVVAVSAGSNFVVALKSDGSIVAWGDNTFGAATIPWVTVTKGNLVMHVPLSNLKAVSASGQVLGVKADGTVAAWGWNKYGQTNVPSNVSGTTAVAAGFKFSLALGPNGKITAWGDNTDGELKTPCSLYNAVSHACVSPISGFSAIGAGDKHALAVRNGDVYAWGDNTFGQTTLPDYLHLRSGSWLAVTGGSNFSMALGKITAPSAPLNVLGSPGDGKVQVSWDPWYDGGRPIDGYKVTSSPGGKTCETTGAKNCVVSGLTNGTAYRFTVTARNAIGTGPASDPSAPVTPMLGLPMSLTFASPTPGASAVALSGTAGPSVSEQPQASELVSGSPGLTDSTGSPGPTASSASPGPTTSPVPTAPVGSGGSGGSGGGDSILPQLIALVVVGGAAIAVGGGLTAVWLRRHGAF